MKPSDFTKFPSASVTQKWEIEQVAMNIMTILSRTGDKFRPIDFEEYKTERLIDGNFTEREKLYFYQVIKFFKSSDTAILFSDNWETNEK